MWRRYLLWFAHEHIDFRHAEIQSILSIYDIPIKYIETPSINKPFWLVELPSEEFAKKIASRSVLVKSCIELWSAAKTVPQLHENLKNSLQNASREWIVRTKPETGMSEHICPNSLIEECCPANKSFKIVVETFCKHFTMKEKVEKIETFSYLPMHGPVKLKDPDVTLAYLEFYGVDPNNVPDQPHEVFFGRWVADGQRDVIQYHSLKKRQFIGNTSMDAQLALIMANQARVRPGDIVLDPFVGSGSLLVAAAHFGGYVWGSDIDFMMLHARTRPTRVGQKVRTKEESIRGNMRQYGTQSRYLDAVVSDFSLPLWRPDLQFDAIITDPPYGVREPTEKIGIERDNYTLTDEHLVNHIPAKVEYGLPQLYGDLLQFAATHLKAGGRLVCWYPMVRDEFEYEQLPSHPRLRLVAACEQPLSRLTCRRLLTYDKCRHVGDSPVDASSGTHNFRVRSSVAQIKWLTDYMATHPAFAHGEFSGSQGRLREQREWEALMEILNEHGSHKSVDQWKVTWRDLCRKARTEASAANRASTSTGINTVVPIVSDTSVKILGIMGTEAAYGISGAEESGIGSSVPVVPEPQEEVLQVLEVFKEAAPAQEELPVTEKDSPLAVLPLPRPANLATSRVTVGEPRRPTRRNIRRRQQQARASDFLQAENEGNNLRRDIADQLAVANRLSAVRSRLAFKQKEKYFALGEMTRREKKERRAEEMARAAFYKAKNGVT